MRFLCLHGLGTNNKVLETQTAAIRAELGDTHTYEFIEGTVKWPKASDLGDLFSEDAEYFAYYDPYNASSMHAAILKLGTYLEAEGPFDGVLAFSHGAALASSYLLDQNTLNKDSEKRLLEPFKCAIFFAAGIPWSVDDLRDGKLTRLDRSHKSHICIPTAHIWAENDPLGQTMSAVLQDLCIPRVRHVHVHREGHTIPGRRSPETLRAAVNSIRRTIWDTEVASG
ncbi:hypothetical protein TWF694_011108 [Orbilia ellipsospora]|uniref:Serine hydrolase domain-containing protein n=1 Tax=Orbilia ellipsospora TaxID=2528407 RepID=A0AAV9XAL9_9PEZI